MLQDDVNKMQRDLDAVRSVLGCELPFDRDTIRLDLAMAATAGFVLAVDVGLAALGSFMGALSAGKSARESILTVVFFPLVIPVLLAGIKLLEGVMLVNPGDFDWPGWLGMALSFAAVFCAASLALFPFIYTGEE